MKGRSPVCIPVGRTIAVRMTTRDTRSNVTGACICPMLAPNTPIIAMQTLRAAVVPSHHHVSSRKAL